MRFKTIFVYSNSCSSMHCKIKSIYVISKTITFGVCVFGQTCVHPPHSTKRSEISSISRTHLKARSGILYVTKLLTKQLIEVLSHPIMLKWSYVLKIGLLVALLNLVIVMKNTLKFGCGRQTWNNYNFSLSILLL